MTEIMIMRFLVKNCFGGWENICFRDLRSFLTLVKYLCSLWATVVRPMSLLLKLTELVADVDGAFGALGEVFVSKP